jgi:uncharacterized membrane protein
MRDVDVSTLHALAQSRVLDAAAFERAMELGGLRPGRREWLAMLRIASLVSGAVLVGAAAIFFVAANWSGMTRIEKVALLAIAVVVPAIAGLVLRPSSLPGRASLTAATLATGALLAFIGQTYQTGADPWQLFAAWALLTLPWAIAATWPPLWCASLTIANVAAGLYLSIVTVPWGILGKDAMKPLMLCAGNIAALAAIEALRVDAMHRLLPRVAATIALGCAAVCGIIAVLEPRENLPSLVAFAAVIAATYARYRRSTVDPYVLAIGAGATIVVLTAGLGKLMTFAHATSYLVLAIFVIGSSAAVGHWLRGVAREGGDR